MYLREQVYLYHVEIVIQLFLLLFYLVDVFGQLPEI